MAIRTKPITVVGSRESVDFPDLGIVGVPAKVDTGADSSAIWASNIHVKDGELSFVLFDTPSPLYTGRVLTTKKFSMSSIKNSFGHAEYRYKTSLKVRLAGRTLHVRFTLANREHNSRPLLIGRRTLHGKFLVDVSAGQQDEMPSRVLIMDRLATSNMAAFVQGVEKLAANVTITHATYEDIQFSFGPQRTCVTLSSTGEDIASFDMVHFKTSGERDITAAMARYLHKRGVKIVDTSSMHFTASSKLYEYVILADKGVPIPASLYVAPSLLGQSYETFVTQLGLPFVLKGIHASQGKDNYLVRTEDEYRTAVAAIVERRVYVVGQKFVPNNGDYRVLVLGRHVALVIYRSRTDDTTHLNNTSQGANARLVDTPELPDSVRTTCLTAAQAMEYGAAGVDMVQDSDTGLWYCFEVNNGPQLATGAFLSEKQAAFAKYIETELSK